MHDISNPTRYVERIEDESWTEHLRRFDRVTASDVALRERQAGLPHRRCAAQGDAVDSGAVRGLERFEALALMEKAPAAINKIATLRTNPTKRHRCPAR